MPVQEYNVDTVVNEPIPVSSALEPMILREIAFEPDVENLKTQLRVREGSRQEDDLETLIQEAQTIARPQAMYRVTFIDSRDEDGVVVNGIPFRSRVLRVNLEGTNRVFPFAVTAGQELHQWSNSKDELLIRYYADIIAEHALRTASRVLKRHLDDRYALGPSSTMSPGSLADWPIQEQQPLFRLLGDPWEAVGIRLTDSMLMIPSKSVSGLRFAVETSFQSCQLCPRDRCPSRRAPYDEGLYERRYRLAKDA